MSPFRCTWWLLGHPAYNQVMCELDEGHDGWHRGKNNISGMVREWHQRLGVREVTSAVQEFQATQVHVREASEDREALVGGEEK